MFLKKNKKYSIAALAVIAIVFALSAFFGFSASVVPAVAEGSAPSFEYVGNGQSAYDFLVTKAEGGDQQASQMLSALTAEETGVSALSVKYAQALKVADLSADTVNDDKVSAAFTLIDGYVKYVNAVEAYNAANSFGPYAAVSVPSEFVYSATVTKQTDVTAQVARLAYVSLENKGDGWKDAINSEYTLKYSIVYQDSTLFEVYSSPDKASMIMAASEEIKESKQEGTNGALKLTFKYQLNDYILETSLSKKTTISDKDFSATADYNAVVISVTENGQKVYDKKTSSTSSPFTVVVDAEYKSYAKTVGTVLTEAKAYFANDAVASEIAASYDKYNKVISDKISAIKFVAKDSLTAFKNSLPLNLYGSTELAGLTAALQAGVTAVESTTSYSALTVASAAAKNAMEEIKTVPETFAEEYADILSNNSYSFEGTESEFDRAEQALTDISGYTDAVRKALAVTETKIFDTMKKSAIAKVNATSAALGEYGANQAMELAVLKDVAISAITSASSANAIVQAYRTYETEVTQKISEYVTKNELTGDGIGITGTFDAIAQLAFNSSVVTEQNESLTQAKANDYSARRLNAIEVYDINLTAGGASVPNIGKEYTVTVKLSDDTVYLLGNGVAPSSLLVAYVREDGRIETYKVTLIFKYDDNTEYSATTDDLKFSDIKWENISEVNIMFITNHFSSYYLMGDTSVPGFTRLTNLLEGLVNSEALTYVIYGIVGILAVALVFFLVSFICSLLTRYSIKFVTNGGTVVKKIKAKYGTKLPEFAVPEKSGYVFLGWYIEESLTYKFNRTVMPRCNTTVYAKWISEEEWKKLQGEENKIVEYYDKLRAILASYVANKKSPFGTDKFFVNEEVLAKIFVENDEVKLVVKMVNGYLKEENGLVYVINEQEKFKHYYVYDEQTYHAAIEVIAAMAKVNGLTEGEVRQFEPSTEEQAKQGYAYVINYPEVANFDDRYKALRAYTLSFGVEYEEKAENGKLLVELIPNEKETLDLALALDMNKYANVLTAKQTVGTLSGVYTIASGEDMGVAYELIERVFAENGYKYEKEIEIEDVDTAQSYQYIITIEGKEEAAVETVAEKTLAEMFAAFRAYAKAFAMYSDCEKKNPADDGKVMLKAKLGDESVEVTYNFHAGEETVTFANEEEFIAAQAKVDTIMEEYGFEKDEEVTVEASEEKEFGYRIKYPAIKSIDEMFQELRTYVGGFALFVRGDQAPDASIDGKVLVKAYNKADYVSVELDPEGEKVEYTVCEESELEEVKVAVEAIMAKYGLKYDVDYVPSTEQFTDDKFGFKIKF